MTGHLTQEQIERYARRTLPPTELLDVDAHLAGCILCRERVTAALPVSAMFTSLWQSLSEDRVERPFITATPRLSRWSVRLEGVHVEPGDAVGVEVVGAQAAGQRPYIRTGSAQVGSGGRIQVAGPASGSARLTVVTRDRRTGRFRVLGREMPASPGSEEIPVGSVEQNSWGHDRLQQVAEVCSDPPALQAALRKLRSLNFFDDVKVYAGDKVFLDESFDDYPDGTTELRTKGLRGLKEFWSGKAAYVTHALHAPGSGPGCWANEAYPNWNRQEVIEITPEDVPSGVPLTFEAAVYMTDVRKGATLGLTHPYQDDGIDKQYHIAYLVLMPTTLLFGGWPGVEVAIAFEPLRWYRIRANCYLDRHQMDVYLDGQLIAQGYPMGCCEGIGYKFSHFAISGTNFLEDVA